MSAVRLGRAGLSPVQGRAVLLSRGEPDEPGARPARRLVAVRLDEWGVPYGTEAHETVVPVADGPAANAVRHGHVPGRDFQLLLRVADGPRPVARIAR